MKVEYIIPEHGEVYPDHARTFEHLITDVYGPWGWVDDLAAEYYSDCSGDEDDWPLTIAIYIEGKFHSNWKVDCEATPQFTAEKVSDDNDKL